MINSEVNFFSNLVIKFRHLKLNWNNNSIDHFNLDNIIDYNCLNHR